MKNNELPTISTYISTTNALFYQSTLEQTIRQTTLFSDEIIVVNSINSTDGTQNLLNSLQQEYPNIIKLYTYEEDYSKKWNTITEKKTFALKKCTSDYCILQDDDECIHEKYIDTIRQLPIQYPEALAFRFNTIHFYRSYNRYQNSQGWYQKKIYMVKNIESIKHGAVNTDLDNHVILQNDKQDDKTNKYIPLDSLSNKFVIDTDVTVYHYGWGIRNDAILLMKKYVQDETWHGKDYWKTHEFPFKFDNPNNLPEFKGTHPKYMIPLIEKEKQFNSMHIKEFETDFNKPFEAIMTETSKNEVTISACILTKNEPTRTKETIFHVYDHVNEIVINDASDDDTTEKIVMEINKVNKKYNKEIKIYRTNSTTNFAEERNKMHSWATSDYLLHIDTDEKFDTEFLKNMRNIIQKSLDNNIIPMMYRFPRKNIELDITKDPDYQVRFLNRKYTKWERNVHEVPTIIEQDKYTFHNKNMLISNLVSSNNYMIEHLPKDRTEIRKHWDILSNNSNESVNKKLLICSMFKDSSLWINDVLSCVDNVIKYNNTLYDNKLIIKVAFLGSKSSDNTCQTLDNYIKKSQIYSVFHWYKEYNSQTIFKSRFEKLADSRNYIINESIKDIYNNNYSNNLNDDDLILFMDSDIKFEKSIIHELIIDMDKYNADIIAPLVCIEDNGVFKNDYFYDTLAFRNINNEQFSHFKPYIFGEIKKSKIKTENSERTKKALERINELNELRKISWEFNLNSPLTSEPPEKLYNEAYNMLDINLIKVNSVGSFYIMKYKVLKNTKYTSNNDSEQVEFMNSARSKGYKIFVSQRLKVLHVNLEKYGLKWH